MTLIKTEKHTKGNLKVNINQHLTAIISTLCMPDYTQTEVTSLLSVVGCPTLVLLILTLEGFRKD